MANRCFKTKTVRNPAVETKTKSNRSKALRTTAAAKKVRTSSKRPPSPPKPLKGVLTRKLREAQKKKTILFLSTGNTCRSPMAAAYFKKLLQDHKIKNIEVRSAGVMTIAGLLATDESKQMLEPYGISLDKHRSQPLTEEMIRRADLILGMTPFHVQMAKRMSEEAQGKTFLIKEYTGTDPKSRPIPDPMGCTLEVYKRCFRQIKEACDALIKMDFVTGKSSKSSRSSRTRRARAGTTRSRKTTGTTTQQSASSTSNSKTKTTPSPAEVEASKAGAAKARAKK